MMSTTRFALAALAAVAVSAVASSAHAAAVAPHCSVSILPEGTSLPSNAPALIVFDGSSNATPTVTSELVTADGRIALVGPTKDVHGISVLQLAGPPVGTHKLATKVACSVGQDVDSETTLVLTAPVAFPKSVGTLTIEPNATPTGMDVIVLEPSPELRAFYPVSVVKLIVGTNEKTRVGGRAEAPGSNVRFNAHTGGICIENGALLRDKRVVTITVTADIAGVADSPAPTTIDVPVDCGAIKWTAANDYKNGNETTSTSTGSDGATGTTTPASSGSAGGCSAAPGSAGSRNAAGLLAGVVALVAGLRRRRQRS